MYEDRPEFPAARNAEHRGAPGRGKTSYIPVRYLLLSSSTLSQHYTAWQEGNKSSKAATCAASIVSKTERRKVAQVEQCTACMTCGQRHQLQVGQVPHLPAGKCEHAPQPTKCLKRGFFTCTRGTREQYKDLLQCHLLFDAQSTATASIPEAYIHL